MPEEGLTQNELDGLVTRAASMDRQDITASLLRLPCTFEVDFTEGYLDSLSLERLRHIFVAVCLHADGGKESILSLVREPGGGCPDKAEKAGKPDSHRPETVDH